MIERAIELASHEQGPKQQEHAGLLRKTLEICKRHGFKDPDPSFHAKEDVAALHEQTIREFHIIRGPLGEIAYAILISSISTGPYTWEHHQAETLRGLLGLLNTDGFIDPPINSDKLSKLVRR